MTQDAQKRAAASSSIPAEPFVVMVGVHPDMKGGIASVLQVYRQVGLDRRVPMAWVTTASEGPVWRKLLVFATGLLRLLRLAMTGRVVLAHMMVATGGSFWRKSILVRLCRLFGIPALLHVHSGLFDRFYDEAPGWQRAYIRSTLAAAAHVLVLGDYWARRLQPIVPAGRLLTMPNGVILPLRSELRSGERGGRDTLLFLGRLLQRKGIFEAIAAFASVADEFPQLRLVCGGDGDPRPVIDALDRLPARVRERIDLAGWIDGEAQGRWYARSLALLLPSHVENLPMCVLEAQAHGVPVIATPVGAVPEAVIDGVTGHLVPVGDIGALSEAIRAIARNGGAWRRMSQAARRHVEDHYAAEVTVARIESLYRGYLQGRCPSVVTRRTT